MYWQNSCRRKPERRQFPQDHFTFDLTTRARARLAVAILVCLPSCAEGFDFPLPLHRLSNQFRVGLQASGRVEVGSRLYTLPPTCFWRLRDVVLNGPSRISTSLPPKAVFAAESRADLPNRSRAKVAEVVRDSCVQGHDLHA